MAQQAGPPRGEDPEPSSRPSLSSGHGGRRTCGGGQVSGDRDLYADLGVPAAASQEELLVALNMIRRAYPGEDDTRRSAAEQAYSVLSDPEQRARYDDRRRVSARPLAGNDSGVGGAGWWKSLKLPVGGISGRLRARSGIALMVLGAVLLVIVGAGIARRELRSRSSAGRTEAANAKLDPEDRACLLRPSVVPDLRDAFGLGYRLSARVSGGNETIVAEACLTGQRPGEGRIVSQGATSDEVRGGSPFVPLLEAVGPGFFAVNAWVGGTEKVVAVGYETLSSRKNVVVAIAEEAGFDGPTSNRMRGVTPAEIEEATQEVEKAGEALRQLLARHGLRLNTELQRQAR